MQVRLTQFREAVIFAATEDLSEAQISLAMAAEKEIQSVTWNWFRPEGTIEKRNIIDTSDLLNSMEVIPPQREGNNIDAALRWNPVHDDNHYASIVHNGAIDFFQDDPDDPDSKRDYAARPWTFRLVPKECRNMSQIETIAGQNPMTYDETNWKVAMQHFEMAFKHHLAMKFKVVR